MTRENVRHWVEERREAIVQLLTEMVAIDSVTGNEGPLAEFCADWPSRKSATTFNAAIPRNAPSRPTDWYTCGNSARPMPLIRNGEP